MHTNKACYIYINAIKHISPEGLVTTTTRSNAPHRHIIKRIDTVPLTYSYLFLSKQRPHTQHRTHNIYLWWWKVKIHIRRERTNTWLASYPKKKKKGWAFINMHKTDLLWHLLRTDTLVRVCHRKNLAHEWVK